MKSKILIAVFSIVTVSSFVFYPTHAKATNKNVVDVTAIETLNEENEFGEDLGASLLTRLNSNDIVNHIMNKTFYIKNAYSGRYLDVYRGIAADGTNIQQCAFNGGNNQKWYINYNGDGTFSFLSMINSNYALDVYGANPNNGANINLWTNHGGDSEKFKIYYSNSIYKIGTKMSNYNRCLAVQNAGCTDEANVLQHDFNNSWNDLWILEPTETDVELGSQYAIDNHNNTVLAFPGCKYDCTNFASQCLLASGFHYDGDWKIYRKNGTYNTDIDSNYKLKYSWETSVPGSWVTAPNFKKYWESKGYRIYQYTGSEITNNPSLAWNLPISQGCIIQMAKNNNSALAEPHHTMYVSGYINDGSNMTYQLTYHSVNTKAKSLLEICRANPNEYFLFFKMV